MLDVAVVGGGPAGSMAARALACSYDVRVLEEHTTSGVPMQCAGLFTDRVLEMSGVRPAVFNSFRRARVVFPDGTDLLLESDGVIVNAVDRTEFDRLLAASAMDAGAEFVYGSKYRSHSVSDRVDIDTSSGSFQARAIVGADGHSSKVAMSLGDNRPEEYIRGMEADVSGVRGDDDLLTIRMGTQVAPGFFTWEIPCGDFTRVGLCTSWSAGPPSAYLDRLIESTAPGCRILSRYCGKIPLGIRPKLSGERCILTGDAAGMVKPVSGGGLHPTCMTIPILEEVLSSALDDDDLSAKRLRRYDSGCRKAIGKDIDRGYFLRRRYVRLSDEQISYAGGEAKRDSIADVLRNIDFDNPADVVRQMLRDPRNYPVAVKLAVRCLL